MNSTITLIESSHLTSLLRNLPITENLLEVLDRAKVNYDTVAVLVEYDHQSRDAERPAGRVIHTVFVRAASQPNVVVVQRFYHDVEFKSNGVLAWNHANASYPTLEKVEDARRLWDTLIGHEAEVCSVYHKS